MFLKNILTKSIKLLSFNNCLKISPSLTQFQLNKPIQFVPFSTTVQRHDLMEFFDDKNNLKEDKVKHGRPWTLDELRLKSNVDLHKLWYVLHKERNMLLTMEECYRKEVEPFPSPERIAKVIKSSFKFFFIHSNKLN